MKAEFKPYDLTLVEPSFGSFLTDLIIDLDHLRKKQLQGSTIPKIFFQLKQIFHTLESIGSARIEGNNTTIAEYIETKMEENGTSTDQNILEIQNIEKAMSFIEETIKDYPINRMYISELHKKVVENLLPPPNGEGDKTPGAYRSVSVAIKKSNHLPPEPYTIDNYMDELIQFINQNSSPKYDLLKMCLSHHRFVWIHPFTNGNGRTVRLFTYAMLVKYGFNVNVGRIINPSAVFCSSRDYYKFLSEADKGTNEGLLNWCEYVLSGLKQEIEKIDLLLSHDYLKKEILFPAINFSLDRKYVTEIESKILKKASDIQVIQQSDIKEFFPGKLAQQISRDIKTLIGKKMLVPITEGSRKYTIRFDNNYLLRGIINSLDEKGFLPVKDNK